MIITSKEVHYREALEAVVNAPSPQAIAGAAYELGMSFSREGHEQLDEWMERADHARREAEKALGE